MLLKNLMKQFCFSRDRDRTLLGHRGGSSGTISGSVTPTIPESGSPTETEPVMGLVEIQPGNQSLF